MKTKEYGKIRILDFIKSENNSFKIPLYQRDYSWKDRNIIRLIEDIKNVIKDTTGKRRHFLGSIIYEKISTVTGEPDTLYIIDGQQRITTIFLLLHCLQKNSTFKISDDHFYPKNKSKLKICLKNADDKLLSEIIHDNYDDSDKYLIKSYRFLEKQIKELINNDRDDALHAAGIYNALEKFWIIEISLDTEDGDDIHTVFESINTTGEKIKLYDMIRNYLHLKQAPEDRESLFENKWEKSENKYIAKGEKEKLNVFSKHFIVLKFNSILYSQGKKESDKNKTKKDKMGMQDISLFEDFKKWFEFEINNGEKAAGLFDDFVKNKNDYYDLFIDENYNIIGKNKDIKTVLYKLNQIKNFEAHRPFLLGVYNYLDIKSIITEGRKESLVNEFIEIINIVDSYYVRLNICKDNVGSILPNLYAELCKKIRGTNEDELTIMMRREIYKFTDFPSDDDFKERLRNNYSGKDKGNLKKYILQRIEYSISNEDVFKKNIELEHIIPKTLDKKKGNKKEKDSSEQWKKELVDEEKAGKEDSSEQRKKELVKDLKKVVEENLWKIGNLTLLTAPKNKEASDNIFSEKKEVYAKSGFKLNQYFKEKKVEKWNADAIEKRADDLSEEAIKIWKEHFYQKRSDYSYSLKKIEDKNIDVTNSNIKSYTIYDKSIDTQGTIYLAKWKEMYLGIINYLSKTEKHKNAIDEIRDKLNIIKKNDKYDTKVNITNKDKINNLSFLCRTLNIDSSLIDLEIHGLDEKLNPALSSNKINE